MASSPPAPRVVQRIMHVIPLVASFLLGSLVTATIAGSPPSWTGLKAAFSRLMAQSTESARAYSAGLLDDGRKYVPEDYRTFVPPPRGGTYIDPVFGTSITRLTEGGAFHQYATVSPFSADNSLIALLTSAGHFIVTQSGEVAVSREDLQIRSGSKVRWSTTDPRLLYYTSGNRLMSFDINSRTRRTLRAFDQFGSIENGNGEDDISEDGDHLVVYGDQRYVGLYRISTNQLSSLLDTGGSGRMDWADVTNDNNVIVSWQTSGPERGQGIELYDREMNFVRQLVEGNGHADRGRDVNGDELLLTMSWGDKSPPPGCEASALEKIRLGDGMESCLFTYPSIHHVSANGGNPWVVLSVFSDNGTANPNLPENWQDVWAPYNNELILMRTDGREIRRLAHHRNRLYGDYYYNPFATLSRDGRYVLFSSNMGIQPFRDYTDIYLLRLETSAD